MSSVILSSMSVAFFEGLLFMLFIAWGLSLSFGSRLLRLANEKYEEILKNKAFDVEPAKKNSPKWLPSTRFKKLLFPSFVALSLKRPPPLLIYERHPVFPLLFGVVALLSLAVVCFETIHFLSQETPLGFSSVDAFEKIRNNAAFIALSFVLFVISGAVEQRLSEKTKISFERLSSQISELSREESIHPVSPFNSQAYKEDIIHAVRASVQALANALPNIVSKAFKNEVETFNSNSFFFEALSRTVSEAVAASLYDGDFPSGVDTTEISRILSEKITLEMDKIRETSFSIDFSEVVSQAVARALPKSEPVPSLDFSALSEVVSQAVARALPKSEPVPSLDFSALSEVVSQAVARALPKNEPVPSLDFSALSEVASQVIEVSPNSNLVAEPVDLISERLLSGMECLRHESTIFSDTSQSEVIKKEHASEQDKNKTINNSLGFPLLEEHLSTTKNDNESTEVSDNRNSDSPMPTRRGPTRRGPAVLMSD